MIFRHSWEAELHAWRYRLDIIPYDANLSDADVRTFTVNPSDYPLRSVDTIEGSFKDVPLGLCEPQRWGFTLAWEVLRSELKTYLRARTNGTGRNVFLLYSDRGTGGATYTLEFAGVQPQLGGGKWTSEEYGLGFSVELVDIVHGTMAAMTGQQLIDGTASYFGTAKQPVLWEVNFGSVDRSDAYQSARYEHTKFTSGFELMTWAYFWQAITESMGAAVAAAVNRRAVALPAAWWDSLSGYASIATNVIRFFSAAADTAPRAVGSMLDKDSLCLISRVFTPSGKVVGGRLSPHDNFSIASYSSAWDWLRDIVEVSCAKVSYVVSVNAGGGNPYLEVTHRALPIFDDGTSIYASTDDALDFSEITEIDPVSIGRAEVRVTYAGDGNLTDYEVNTGVVRTDRSFTIRCEQLNNLPSVLPDVRESQDDNGLGYRYIDAVSNGLLETNLVCSFASSVPQRCHEKVRIYYTATGYVEVDDTISSKPPALVTAAMKEAYALWAKEVQSLTGLPNAHTAFLVETLGRSKSAGVAITWRLDYLASRANLSALGERMILSGDLCTELSDLAWGEAFVTAVSIDIIAGTCKMTLMLVGAS